MQTLSPKAQELFESLTEAAKDLEKAAYAGMSRGTIQRRGWKIKERAEDIQRYVRAVEAQVQGGELADVPSRSTRKAASTGRSVGRSTEAASAR